MRALVLVLAVALVPAAVHAQDAAEEDPREQARAHFTAGVELSRMERWGEAAREFESARELYEAPSILVALGGALQRLSRYREARDVFLRWLAIAGQGDDERAAVQHFVDVCRTQIQALRLAITPAEAEVLVDGEPRALEEGVLWLDPGPHAIEVRAEGFEAARHTVDAQAGGESELEVALDPIPTPAAEPEPPEPAAADVSPFEAEPAPSDVVPSDREPAPSDVALAPSDDASGWVVLGVGAGATAIGAILIAVGAADWTRVTNATKGTRWVSLEGADRRAPPLIISGSVVAGAGLAAVALGAVLVAVTGSSHDDVTLGIGPGSLLVRGRF